MTCCTKQRMCKWATCLRVVCARPWPMSHWRVVTWSSIPSCHDVAGVCVVLSVRGECYAVVTTWLECVLCCQCVESAMQLSHDNFFLCP
jgi:hypothetical protein